VIYFYEKSIVISSNETYNICTGPPGGVTWIFPYFQYQFIFLRIIIPFIITIIVSFLTIYKLCASKRKMGKSEWKNMRREVQYSRALIIMDILFIIFRLPTLVNMFGNNNETFIFAFIYSAFAMLGAVHKVFLFFIFIVFNRIYRKLFKQSMCCRKT
jgi:DMSO/TMAO reductase YedYZ heme-binding membrane subunit